VAFVAFMVPVPFRASCARTAPDDKVTIIVNSINALRLLIFIPQAMLFLRKI
jgi:hypothetical protein